MGTIASSFGATANSQPAARYDLLASPWHTALILLALGTNAYRGFNRAVLLRHAHTASRPALYLRTILVEWFILALVLAGVHLHKTSVYLVLGERWRSRRQFLTDLAIAVAFLIVSVSVSSLLGSHSHTHGTDPAVKFLMPETATEKWLWVLVAVSAGICEEAVFRGYLQHQFIAITRSTPLGLILSAALFGASHAYQGWRPACLIGCVAVLAGALALWRKSVRPGMIAHTLQDLLALVVPH